MVEEARKEPSMEEILSSIRKIIADDDVPAGDASEAYHPADTEDDAFNSEFEPDTPMFAGESPEPPSDDVETVTSEIKETRPATAEAPQTTVVTRDFPKSLRKETTEMLSAPLADSKTADDAAAYLSKLLDTVDFGDGSAADTSIETLVKELLRPMMKAWLDENLPAVVERHVEAEVARIARMAR